MRKPNLAAMNPAVAKAIEEMMAKQGENFSLDKINLAELARRTGLSRQKLRRMKAHDFEDTQHAAKGRKSPATLLSGYTGILDELLRNGVTNSAVCLSRLKENGFTGSQTTVKRYIASHKYLVPAPRHAVAPQGNRGRRYFTAPGEAFQMDWGFVTVDSYNGNQYRAACFAMICHHCGQRYIEFFPNARQENLFIGMVHAFLIGFIGIERAPCCFDVGTFSWNMYFHFSSSSYLEKSAESPASNILASQSAAMYISNAWQYSV